MLPDAVLTMPGCTMALSNVAIMLPQWHNKVSHPTFPRAAPLPNTGLVLPTEQITQRRPDTAESPELGLCPLCNCIGAQHNNVIRKLSWVAGWRKVQKIIKANSICFVLLSCLEDRILLCVDQIKFRFNVMSDDQGCH